MIRTAACIVVALLALPAAAQDQAVTTRELYSDCSVIQPDGNFDERDRGRAFFCNGYLRGSWESMQDTAFCSGELIHIVRLRAAFKRVVDENPQSMDKPAAWAVYAAFKLAYPCASGVSKDNPVKRNSPASTM
ncbi:MAG: Rap1a/Tai family immunity protein [Alphaproteobacteria bacterium]